MAQTFTIDSIEGNSYIGVPVFSRFGQMQNYNYIVMSPQKKVKQQTAQEDPLIDKENERFKLFSVEPAPATLPKDAEQEKTQKAVATSKGTQSVATNQVKPV